MTEPIVAPYGSWKSPITSDLIVSESIGLGQIVVDGEDIYWIEMRPTEGGRGVVVRRTPDGRTADVNPPPFNARTRVHEYGGGSYVAMDGVVYFSNFDDQQLYQGSPGEEPRALTPPVDMRYADAVIDRQRGRLICIREDHTAGGEAVNTVVGVNLAGGDGGQVLVSGHDFYSSPRLSPDGARLAWLTWNHPNMPWDGTELWVAELDSDGSPGKTERVAGSVTESIYQPEWSPDGVLHFVSDRTGWWNFYRRRDGRIEALCEMEAEFGQPAWVFATSTYAFDAPGRIICSYVQQGTDHLASLDTATGKLDAIETPYTTIGGLQTCPGGVCFTGGSATEPASIVRLDLPSRKLEVLRRSSNIGIDPGYLSIPRPIEFPTEQGLTAHGIFYAPHNRDYTAPEGERPPLIVAIHGGPTGATDTELNLGIQFWTSRGIGILDVNYGGSTGYGRAYRERLDGQWGVVDVDDCVNGARYLAERGEVAAQRLAIHGGSAGGYTTLAALTFRDLFKAGASYFGVSDCEALAKETHKFESRYLDRLIGPYPERKDLYEARSPIHFTDRLSVPLILFQGLEDKVVPPNQAETMFDAVRAKGIPTAYLPFEGEQHGFRRKENIKRALDAELYFYGKVFGFEPADQIEPVQIENL